MCTYLPVINPREFSVWKHAESQADEPDPSEGGELGSNDM